MPMQVKLLRALQESEFERVGGVRTLRVDVRLIAATNMELEEEINNNNFREDLFYRLNVVPIRMSALRERSEDVPELAEHFLEKFNKRLARKVNGIHPEAMELLKNHRWSGNIRELENVVERTLLFCDGDQIRPEDLPGEISQAGGGGLQQKGARRREGSASGGGEVGKKSLKDVVKSETKRVEKSMIQRALEETGGNVTQAAKLLGISRKGLQIKMKELDLR